MYPDHILFTGSSWAIAGVAGVCDVFCYGRTFVRSGDPLGKYIYFVELSGRLGHLLDSPRR